MALNAADGMMARTDGLATPLGAALNEGGDVVADLALYAPLALLSGQPRWPVVVFCLGAALTEICGLAGCPFGRLRRYDGPMGKSDRALFVGALALVSAIAPSFRTFWPWAFFLAAILEVVTCWNRLLKIRAETRERR